MGTLSEISMSDVGKSELSNAFKAIQPERNLSKGEAVTLVKTKFETQDENSLSDMLHNYDETDFDLHFEFDTTIEKNMELFNPEQWEKLDASEKKEVITEMVELINGGLGIEGKTDVIFFEDFQDNCGWYNEHYRTIGVNEATFSDSLEVLDTIAHEMKHAFQRFRADKAETNMDKFYKYSFEHYISPIEDVYGNFVNFFEYYDQFIEAEARAVAKIFTGKVVL